MSRITAIIGIESCDVSSPRTLARPSPQAASTDESISPAIPKPIFARLAHHPTNESSRLALPALLVCSLAVAVGAVFSIAYRGWQEQAALQATQIRSDSFYGAITPVERFLAPQYVDSDGNMLADLPSALQLVDPDTLVVAHYEGDYDDEPRVNWPAFQAHLEAITGRRVVLQEYLHTASEVEAIAAGRIHVVIPHSADVPCLVNNCGFIPVAALGTEDGPNGNHMVIAVSPNSKIQSLADLEGITLICTRPLSITGYRAAVTILAQQADMQLDSDYKVYLTDGQARSIRGLAAGWFEAVAISHDKLEWALAAGIIDRSGFRPIYESEIIPRRTVGHIHNLAPGLAAKIKNATLSFDNERISDEQWETLPMRFYAINYQQDFQFVRRMDNSFDPRCGKLLAARR
jgi:phosphonate transport system substrate-binding protein